MIYALRIARVTAAVVLLAVFSIGCASREPDARSLWNEYQSGRDFTSVKILHPFNGALFPPEFPSPLLLWENGPAGCDSWLIGVTAGEGHLLYLDFASGSGCRLPQAAWDEAKAGLKTGPARLTVLGFNRENPDSILGAGEAAFSISEDPVEAPLFYREVNLPFKDAVRDPSRIQWRFGTIDSAEKPPIVLDKLPVCGNCHSFSARGEVMGLDVDYANDKGSYAVAEVDREMILDKESIFSWSDSNRKKSDKTFGLLSQVSPDGRYVVSTVRDRSVFVPKDDLAFSQLFFPLKGVLEVYDREKNIFFDLPGANDPKYVQSNPSWSPDGKYIVFARSEAYELKTLNDQGQILLTQEDCVEFLAEGREFKFDLYRIPFNGGKGGKAEPLQGASGNGLSNFFAKYSPDGKWIVFCQSRSFMLLQPDSRLYIIPAEGGEGRELACNTGRMNSWHSWSPNSRWLVFSSKEFTPYTQLMIAHIDEEGRSAPPVLLDRMTDSDRAANIPEFVNVEPKSIERIVKAFIDDNSLYRAGFEYTRANDPANAEIMFKKALDMNPRNVEAHLSLGYLLGNRGEYEEAVTHLNEAIRIDPHLAKAYSNLGYVLMWKGDLDAAFGNFFKAAQLNPKMAEAQLGMGVLRLQSGDLKLAEQQFRLVLGLEPENLSAGVGLAKALRRQGNTAGALDVLIKVLRVDPSHLEALLETGELLAQTGRGDEALIHFKKALNLAPGNPRAIKDIEQLGKTS